VRNMSYAKTTQQFLNGTKDVTRRLGWRNVRVGQVIQGVLKGMGLKPGEKIQPLRLIVVREVSFEPLRRMIDEPEYGRIEAIREGFPHLDGAGFVAMFCDGIGATPETEITRITFRYIVGGRA
jgi:hypothetical protein